jgi:hypothetical protein
MVNGVERWRDDVTGGDRQGHQATLTVDLNPGTLIEQLVHPIGNAADDMTEFRMTIKGP